jgi:hypothetical protein
MNNVLKYVTLTWCKTAITHLAQNSYHSLGAKQLSLTCSIGAQQLSLTWRKTAITLLLAYFQRVTYFSTLFRQVIK